MKKIIFGLAVCLALSSFESHAGTDLLLKQTNEMIQCLTKMKDRLSNINLKEIFYKKEQPYLKNENFIDFRRQLRGLNSALQNSKTKFNTILNKGSKIFDEEKNNQLFASEDLPSDLKESYSNALTAWKEIKRMPSDDEKYDEKLNNFREKIRSLYQDIQN